MPFQLTYVTHTELPPSRSSKATVEDVAFEDVRQSFLNRLHSEQARLTVLGAALGSAQVDPASAFVDLEMFAHRLRGAAAVFELPELRDAAKALELAAAAAATERASIGEPLVQQTIQILTSRLTCLNGFTRPSNAAGSPLPAN